MKAQNLTCPPNGPFLIVLVIVLVLVLDGSVVPKQSLVRLRSPSSQNPAVHTGER